MASFPSVSFTKDKVKVRWREPYTSEGLNAKFTGIPRGVYVGFTPTETAPSSNILRLAPDATEAVSVLAVKSNTTTTLVHIVETANVDLDFTSHSSFPVYVIAKAVYQAGAETTAQIITQSGAPNGRNEIGICKITSLGPMVIVTDPAVDAAARQQPLARSTQTFGFMAGGSVESLTAAVATTADVNNSKVDTQSVTQATLTARLTADFGGVNLGKTLSRTLEFVKGNAVNVSSLASINISGSFAKFDRHTGPAINIASGGSESADGAVTTGAHPVLNNEARNVIYFRDRNRGIPTTGTAAGSHGVYGRLSYATSAILGTTAFTNAGTGVVGTGTDFTSSCVVGDIIKGGDGNYYEIAVITDNLNLTLATAYQSANIAGVTSDRRRFTATFYYQWGGAELAYTFPAATILMYPFFPVFSSLNVARYDATPDALAGATPLKMALTDGTTPFTAVQTGVTPTATDHLSTKGYVDGLTYTPAYYRGKGTGAGNNGLGVTTTILFGGSVFSSGVSQNAATGIFTVSEPGKYFFFVQQALASGAAANSIVIQSPPAAAGANKIAEMIETNIGTTGACFTCAAVLDLTSTTTFDAYLVGVTATNAAADFCSIFRIG